MRGMGQVVTVTIGLIVLLVAFALINPNFWSPTNRTNLLRQIAPILIIGIAQSYVLITGNIDLSIGSVVGMSTMVAATLMSKGIMSPIPALLVTLLCCLLIGVLNGLLVAKFKLPPFIATLGTMTVARGIAQLVNGNYNTDSIMKFYPEAAQTFKNVFYYGKRLVCITASGSPSSSGSSSTSCSAKPAPAGTSTPPAPTLMQRGCLASMLSAQR